MSNPAAVKNLILFLAGKSAVLAWCLLAMNCFCAIAAGGEVDLSRKFEESPFSSASIASEPGGAAQKHSVFAHRILSYPNSSPSYSNQSGFHYNPAMQTSHWGDRLVREEIREAMEADDAQYREEAAHPFWYADFWTKSPIALLGFILGGDHFGDETPLTPRDRLIQSDYSFGEAIDKVEKKIQFDQLEPQGEVIVGAPQPVR